MIASMIDGNINVENVSVEEYSLIRNTMTDDFID